MSTGLRQTTYDTSTDRSLGRVRRCVASWLGLIVLALNVIAGAALPARAADAAAPFAQDIRADRIVVCTAAGMVVMDRDGHVVEPGKAAGHTDFCVFCLPLMHGGAQASAAPAFVAITVPALPAGGFVPAEPAAVTPARLAGASSPRAPPRS